MSRIVSIHVRPAPAAPTRAVTSARLLARRGVDGDHKCLEKEPEKPRSGRDVTLIELEALEAVKREYGVEISPEETRRNVLTEGVALNHLVGREFRIGDATLRGVRLCEPCSHLEGLTRPGVREALVHRGGLRADVLTDGTIRPGDAVAPI
jgi:MOSC domain-containing protein YiiM